MTRTELEHIIRAVAAITNETELIVIGSPSNPRTVSGCTEETADLGRS